MNAQADNGVGEGVDRWHQHAAHRRAPCRRRREVVDDDDRRTAQTGDDAPQPFDHDVRISGEPQLLRPLQPGQQAIEQVVGAPDDSSREVLDLDAGRLAGLEVALVPQDMGHMAHQPGLPATA